MGRVLGFDGLQRFYVGRWQSGLLWMFSGGLLLVGWIIDAWLLSDFVEEYNAILFQREFDALTASDGAALDASDYMLAGDMHTGDAMFPVSGFYYPQDDGDGGEMPPGFQSLDDPAAARRSTGP